MHNIILLSIFFLACMAMKYEMCASPECGKFDIGAVEEVSTLDAANVVSDNWIKTENVPQGATVVNKQGKCVTSCEWFYSLSQVTDDNINSGQICTECKKRFVVYPKVNGQCYTFPDNLTSIGADQVNKVKEKCATKKAGSCMCLPNRLILHDIGILLQNVRRIGAMTIRYVSKKLDRVIRLKKRSMKQIIAFLKARLQYRKKVVKQRLALVFDQCQRNATRNVVSWIRKNRPPLLKILRNHAIPVAKRRKARKQFMKRLRERDLKSRVKAVLDARYVRVLASSYLSKFNIRVETRIRVLKRVQRVLARKTSRLFKRFRAEIKDQVVKDTKLIRKKAKTYAETLKQLQNSFNIEQLFNMTLIKATYENKKADILDKFSWFDPAKLPQPSLNKTEEAKTLRDAINEIFTQVLNTREERYKDFAKNNSILELYEEIRNQLRKVDARFSAQIRGTNMLPMPLISRLAKSNVPHVVRKRR